TKMHQVGSKISSLCELSGPGQGMLLQHRPMLPKIVPVRTSTTIPALVKGAQCNSRFFCQFLTIAVEKSLKLGLMCIILLRIDVPDHRPGCPLRTHERIFSAHKIAITCP